MRNDFIYLRKRRNISNALSAKERAFLLETIMFRKKYSIVFRQYRTKPA